MSKFEYINAELLKSGDRIKLANGLIAELSSVDTKFQAGMIDLVGHYVCNGKVWTQLLYANAYVKRVIKKPRYKLVRLDSLVKGDEIYYWLAGRDLILTGTEPTTKSVLFDVWYNFSGTLVSGLKDRMVLKRIA